MGREKKMAYKVDVKPSLFDLGRGERFVVRIIDKDNDECVMEFGCAGTKAYAFVAGLRIAYAYGKGYNDGYDKGYADGTQNKLTRMVIVDEVDRWGGIKE